MLAILSALVEERTGLHYGLLDHEVLAEKAGVRAAEAGFESLLDYYYFLRYDPGADAEMDALVDALVVGETYFFRELAPLEALVDASPQTSSARGARPRIWSAACATGEEPLTLAMLLEERGLLADVELIASRRQRPRPRAGAPGTLRPALAPRAGAAGARRALPPPRARRHAAGGAATSPTRCSGAASTCMDRGR